jgi:drug/metabolite transporter (DMT)-like permease
MWLILAILGHFLNAFVYLTDKAFVVKFYPSPKALAFISGMSGIFLFLIFPWYLKPASYAVVFSGIGAGFISIPALASFFKAMQKDEVSRVVPAVGSMIPVFTFGLSYWILTERLTNVSLAAFILLALGGILIAFRSFTLGFMQRAYALFALEILAAFLFSFSFVLQKYAFDGTDDFSAFLWSRVGAVGAALGLLFSSEVREKIKFWDFSKNDITIGLKEGTLYVVSRIFAGVAPLIILTAIAFGSATLVNALQGLQYVFLFILAAAFSRRWPEIFNEEMTRRVIVQKSIATALIIAGLALLV